jgi:Ca-activated chloride channel family protein
MDPRSLHFAQPYFLWLLVVAAVLGLLGIWRIARRRRIVRQAAGERLLPVKEQFGWAGHAMFWLCLVLATSLCIVALARPQARLSVVRRAAADFVILQDGSASMYARDVQPDRWRRSVRFLRTFASSLGWKGDRVALALFAHLASPQARLTKDPTAFFFFLDHLGAQSPFRLEDNPTWDTNIEEGLRWGLGLIETDEQLFGKSANVKAFVVISDGQTWSGNVANALAQAERRQVPVYVVGVGTPAGAMIPPTPVVDADNPPPVIRAVLDRDSLQTIARAGGGQYFELDTEPDQDIAARIITAVKRRANVAEVTNTDQDLYWHFLFAAGTTLCLGTLLLRDRTELWWHAATSVVALFLLSTVAS